jgi:hypothetical protein
MYATKSRKLFALFYSFINFSKLLPWHSFWNLLAQFSKILKPWRNKKQNLTLFWILLFKSRLGTSILIAYIFKQIFSWKSVFVWLSFLESKVELFRTKYSPYYRQINRDRTYSTISSDILFKLCSALFSRGNLIIKWIQKKYARPCSLQGARGSVVGWGTMLQAGKSRVRFPMWSHNLMGLHVLLQG